MLIKRTFIKNIHGRLMAENRIIVDNRRPWAPDYVVLTINFYN